MKVIAGEGALGLEVLFKGGNVFLRGGRVARSEIAAQLIEGLGQGIGGGRSGRGGSCGRGLREGLLQGGEIGLRGGQVTGLEILTELLHLLLGETAGGAQLIGAVGAVLNRRNGH